MNLELTQQEKELLQKLMYNELLKQNYLVKTEQIVEMPCEVASLIEKLQDKDDEDEN